MTKGRRTKTVKEKNKIDREKDMKKSEPDDRYTNQIDPKSQSEVRKRIGISSRPDNNMRHRSRHHSATHAVRWSRMFSKYFSRTFLVAAVACVIIVVGMTAYRYRTYLREKVRMPLNLPKLVHPNISTAQVEPESYWGTYRPHTYFGLKTRHPMSPVLGLMWLDQLNRQTPPPIRHCTYMFTYDPHTYFGLKTRHPMSPVLGLMWLDQLNRQTPPPIRHWCNHDDKLQRYGWTMHDGANFGVQELEEKNFVVKTEFMKRHGGENGGDWTTHISVVPRVTTPQVVSLMFYFALDGQGRVEPVIKQDRLAGLKGVTQDLGYFSLEFTKPEKSKNFKQNYLVTYVPRLDRINEITISGLTMGMWDRGSNQGYYALAGRLVPRDAAAGPNMFMYQITGTPPFQLEVIFESGSVTNRPERLSGHVFNQEIAQMVTKFNQRFTDTFDLESRDYSKEDISVAKAAMSNMLGGIGYFYGSSIVKSQYNDQPVDYWVAPLHTGVPSRSFFPRGFLWDEGFHNLLISQWDHRISRSIFSHWLDLINTEGWIPREQILGDEARARVPPQFIVQRNENANPPTWFLVFRGLVKKLARDEKNLPYIHVLYSRLRVWYRWYNTTQSGPRPGTYRWRGRDSTTNKQLNPLTLTSGLDDYPRASHPSPQEYHVDLRCWIALASSVMAEIAELVHEDPKLYRETYDYLSDNVLLDELHWSDENQAYTDYGLHTDGLKLQQPKPPPGHTPGQPLPPEYQDKVRVVTKEPKYQLVKSFGYVSLFPFITKIMDPSSSKLMKIINDIKNPQLLWTEFGLRSLAKNAPLYNKHNTQHDPPYWRGSIWINLNYLTVAALHHYANTPGPYQDNALAVYTDLRHNLISNIVEQYKSSGYIWEQYDDKTGKGKGTHPFTGWSAMFVLMMAEKY